MIGVDIVSVRRMESVLRRNGRFAERVFCEGERKYCESRGVKKYECYASRFAAKEAVAKALGIPIWKIGWKNICIGKGQDGRPVAVVRLEGKVIELHVSISDEREYAVAVALCNNIPQGGERSEGKASRWIGDRR